MLARFSKCDFWIPEQICDFHIFFQIKNIFSRDQNIFRKISKKYFFRFFSKTKIFIEKSILKNRKFREKIAKKNQNFRIFHIDFSMKIFGFRKKSEQIFFRDLPKNILVSKKNIFYLEKIYENRKFAQESKNHT